MSPTLHSDTSGSRPRWVLAAAVVAFTLVIVELTSFVALSLLGARPAGSKYAMYAESACLKADEFNYGKQVQTRAGMDVMLGRIPHPFFGFVTNPGDAEAEWRRATVGADFENELRYRVALGDDPRPRDTFTVGIFGASVAHGFAEWAIADGRLAAALRERVPGLADRDIVVRNMAVGASRQPSQFAIAVHYLDLFDMTINLDGYSEQAIHMYPDYPIEFPMFGDVFFSRAGAPIYLRLLAAEHVCSMASAIGAKVPGLRYSNAYYLFWYTLSVWMKQSVQNRVVAPAAGAGPGFGFDDDEVRRLYADYYARYTRYQHQVLAANGVQAYFFLQPNQYVAGSKPFSAHERQHALHLDDDAETRARYPHLQTAIAELGREGVPAYDLTDVFEEVGETVYVDTCCHVNELGNRLMADRMVGTIAAARAASAER